jgi:hypothetical protein
MWLTRKRLIAESHYCGCSDRPRNHLPYVVVLLKMPKGDLPVALELNS